MQLLYYVALPLTEEVLNLVTLFSIKISNLNLVGDAKEELGLFMYRAGLAVETVEDETEWLLDANDAIQVLAFYANRDFNSICEYLNNIPDKPFTACIDTNYLSFTT